MRMSYFQKIDRLHAKYERGWRLGLREFLWIKWAEGHQTATGVGFVRWLRSHRESLNKRVFAIWSAVWDAYLKSDLVTFCVTECEFQAMLRVTS